MKQNLLLFFFTLMFSAKGNSQDTANKENKLSNSDSLVFQKVDSVAEFPGGDQAWAKYLQSRLNPNVASDNGAKKGAYRVVIIFTVSKDGTISDLVPLTHFGYGMEEEVIRIIKAGPNWKPAIQNGRKVTAYRSQSVTFFVS